MRWLRGKWVTGRIGRKEGGNILCVRHNRFDWNTRSMTYLQIFMRAQVSEVYKKSKEHTDQSRPSPTEKNAERPLSSDQRYCHSSHGGQ